MRSEISKFQSAAAEFLPNRANRHRKSALTTGAINNVKDNLTHHHFPGLHCLDGSAAR
jgi:hypothetical protein